MAASAPHQRISVAALAVAAALCAASGAAAQEAPAGSPAGGMRLRAGVAPIAAAAPSSDATSAAVAPTGRTAASRPRAKRNAAVGSARKPLPDLVAYRGAPGQRLRRGETARKIIPAPTVAAIPYPDRRRATPEQDPYAPTGVDVGGLRLRPFVEAEGGYDDNPNRAAGRRQGSSVARVGAGLQADADWGRHAFKANLRGGYTRYFAVDDADRPDLAAAASLRLDATRDTQLLFDASANLDTQRPGSPKITSLGTRGATLEGRPLVARFGAGAAATQSFNRLSATLRGSVDRTDYADGDLSDGSKLSLGGQSFTTYGLRARLAYEATPGVKPFVEASIDQRRHDERVDQSGFARDSKGLTLRAGTSFELTRTLTGEASVGHATRRYEDARLGDLRGAVFDAALVWTATPLTTITLKASTDLAETNIANASGAVARKGSIELSHALLRNLTLTGALSLAETEYRGVDLKERSLAATLRADYALTRSVVVRGAFTHERLKSSAPNSDYTANAFLLGLRLQR